jgi:2-keto-4-pentenoate hydratase/2-oxohepta-3-ene-1,7-dioic acid hydratase in catechol pathway
MDKLTRRRSLSVGATTVGAMLLPSSTVAVSSSPAIGNDRRSNPSLSQALTMATHVIRFAHSNRIQWGLVFQDRIMPLPGDFATTADFIRCNPVDGLKEFARASAVGRVTLALADVQILSPVTTNQQFICQGANYRQHMIESGMDPDAKSYNMIFTKATSCISPADSELVKPAHVRFLDYEIELGLILKRDVLAKTMVTDANLHEFVAGAVIVNDYSARDIQIPQTQFYKGKSFRTFGPVGPFLCLLTPSEMKYLHNLQLTLTVNGQVRQRDSTANLVFGPAETLTELSGVQNLFVGDLLSTGTPAGCALSVPSPFKQRVGALLPEKAKWAIFNKVQEGRDQYLKAGDIVEARIQSPDGAIDLGVQRNKVISGQ